MQSATRWEPCLLYGDLPLSPFFASSSALRSSSASRWRWYHASRFGPGPPWEPVESPQSGTIIFDRFGWLRNDMRPYMSGLRQLLVSFNVLLPHLLHTFSPLIIGSALFECLGRLY